MNTETILIKHPYSFRQEERDAISKAIGQSVGVQVVSWWHDWQKDAGRDVCIDHIDIARVGKTQRKAVTQVVLTIMHAYINLHHDRKSFAEPCEITE